MVKDNSAVRNQKVFVSLESVLNLQHDYGRAVDAFDATGTSESLKTHNRARVAAYEEIIKTLQLPIRLQQHRP